MIKYQLRCEHGHEFEGWFQSSAAYDRQAAAGQVVCPVCGSARVEKAIMAPSISSRPANRTTGAMSEMMSAMRAEVEARSEYVGPRFAEEARRIHLEETEPRSVYGEATQVEVKSLLEDGIPVLPLPASPKDKN